MPAQRGNARVTIRLQFLGLVGWWNTRLRVVWRLSNGILLEVGLQKREQRALPGALCLCRPLRRPAQIADVSRGERFRRYLAHVARILRHVRQRHPLIRPRGHEHRKISPYPRPAHVARNFSAITACTCGSVAPKLQSKLPGRGGEPHPCRRETLRAATRRRETCPSPPARSARQANRRRLRSRRGQAPRSSKPQRC